MLKVDKYITNVAKSTLYAASDVMGEYYTSVKDFKNTNKEVFIEAYTTIKDYRNTFRHIKTNIQKSDIYTAANLGINNLLSDLKTGNFYNAERISEYNTKYGGLGDNSEWDMDEDDFDWGSSNVTDGEKVIATAIKKNNKMSTVMMADSVAKGHKAIVESSRENTTLLYMQQEKLLNKVGGGIDNITSLLKNNMEHNNKVQGRQVENTNKFFTNMEKNTNRIVAQLDEMLQMQRNLYNNTPKEKERKKNTITDITSGGPFNIKEYAKIVKGNLKDFINQQTGGVASMGDAMGGNLFAILAADPMGGLLKGAINKTVSSEFKKASKDFDKSLQGYFSTLMAKASNARGHDDPFMQTLGNIFGVKIHKEADNMRTDKYTRGPVPFDGITKKAITEVMPFYLRKMTSILTGEDEQVFDYKTGKWTTVKAVQKRHNDWKNAGASQSISELTSMITEALGKDTKSIMSSHFKQEEFKKNYDRMARALYNSNGDIGVLNRYSEYGMDEEFVKMIKKILADNQYHYRYDERKLNDNRSGNKKVVRGLDRSQGVGGYKSGVNTRSVIANLSKNILSTKSSRAEQMESMETEADIIDRLLYAEGIVMDPDSKNNPAIRNKHGDYNVKKAFESPLAQAMKYVKDEYNNTIFNYLQGIKRDLTAIRTSGLSMLGLGSRDKVASNGMMNFEKPGETDSIYDASQDIKEGGTRYRKYNEHKRKEEESYNNRYERAYDDWVKSGKKGRAPRKVEEYQDILGYLSDQQAKNQKYMQQDVDGKKDIYDIASEWGLIKKSEADKYKAVVYDKDKKMKEQFKGKKGFEKVALLRDYANKLLKKPWEAVTDSVISVDKFMSDLFFGKDLNKKEDDEDKDKGLFERIKDGFTRGFDSILGSMTDKFQEFIEGEKFKKFKAKYLDPVKKFFIGERDSEGIRSGGLAGGAIGSAQAFLRRNAEDVKNMVKKDAKTVYDKITKNEDTTTDTDNNNNENDFIGPQFIGPRRPNKVRRTRKITKIRRFNRHSTVPEDDEVVENTNAIENVTHPIIKISDTLDKIAGILSRLTNINNPNNAQGLAKGGINTSGRAFNSVVSSGEIVNGSVVPAGGPYITTIPNGGYVINPANASTRSRQAGQERSFINKLKSNANASDGLAHSSVLESMQDPENQKFAGELFARGGLGLGAGLLLGMPLLSAGIGIATGFTKKSNFLSETLFGKVVSTDENGNALTRNNDGLISTEIQKSFPSAKKFGVIGGLAGLFTPLGPIGGLIAGSAIGFAKNSEAAQEFLFGDGSILNKENRNKLKKALPAMGIGSVATAFLGPFGLLGNLALGATAGYVTSMDKFKEAIFGKEEEIVDKDGNVVTTRKGGLINKIKGAAEPLKDFGKTVAESLADAILGKKGKDGKRKGGLVGMFKNTIIDPIGSALTPILQEVKLLFKNTIGTIPGMVSKYLKNNVGSNLSSRAGKLGGKLAKNVIGLGKAGLAVTASPLMIGAQALKGIGSHFRKKHIRQGNADYMTAEERMNFRNKHISMSTSTEGSAMDGDDFINNDMAIAELARTKNIDELEEIRNLINYGTFGEDARFNADVEARQGFNSDLEEYIHKADIHKIMKLLNKDKGKGSDYAAAARVIKRNKIRTVDGDLLSDAQRSDILKKLSNLKEKRSGINTKMKNWEKNRVNTASKLEDEYGITFNPNDKKSSQKLMKYFETEIVHKKAGMVDDENDPLKNNTSEIERNTAALNELTELVAVGNRLLSGDIRGDEEKVSSNGTNTDTHKSHENNKSSTSNSKNGKKYDNDKYYDILAEDAKDAWFVFVSDVISRHEPDNINKIMAETGLDYVDARKHKDICWNVPYDGVIYHITMDDANNEEEGKLFCANYLNNKVVSGSKESRMLQNKGTVSKILSKIKWKGLILAAATGPAITGMYLGSKLAGGLWKKSKNARGKIGRSIKDGIGFVKTGIGNAILGKKQNVTDEEGNTTIQRQGGLIGGIKNKFKVALNNAASKGKDAAWHEKLIASIHNLPGRIAKSMEVDEDGKPGLLRKIFGISKLVVGVPLMVGFLNQTVFPFLKNKIGPVLLGKKNNDGEYEGGLVSGIVNPLKKAFKYPLTKIREWFTNTGSFSDPTSGMRGMIHNFKSIGKYMANTWLNGVETIMQKWMPQVVGLIVRNLPAAIGAVIENLLPAIKSIFTSKESTKVGSSGNNLTSVASQVSSGTGYNMNNSDNITFCSTFGQTFSLGNDIISSNKNSGDPFAAINNIGNKSYNGLGNSIKTTGDSSMSVVAGNTSSSGDQIYYAANDVNKMNPLRKDPNTGAYYKASDLSEYSDSSLKDNDIYQSMKTNEATPGGEAVNTNNSFGERLLKNLVAGSGSSMYRGGRKIGANLWKNAGKVLKHLPFMHTLGGLVEGTGRLAGSLNGDLSGYIAKHGGIKNAIKSIPSSLISGAGDVITSAKDGIVNTVKKPFDTLKNLKNKANNVLNAGINLGKEIKENGFKKTIKEKASNTLKKVGDTKPAGIVKKIVGLLKNILNKILTCGPVKKLLAKMGKEGISEAAEKALKESTEKVAKEAGESLLKQAGKKLAQLPVKLAAKISPAGIAFVVADFVTGMGDARNILKITSDEVEVEDQILAGFSKVLSGLLFVLPESVCCSLIMNTIGNVLFKDKVDEIKKEQAESENALKAYNEEHGTDLSIEEYNNKFNATWYTKTKNAVKKAAKQGWNNTIGFGVNLFKGIKDKGFAKGVGEAVGKTSLGKGAKWLWDKIKGNANADDGLSPMNIGGVLDQTLTGSVSGFENMKQHMNKFDNKNKSANDKISSGKMDPSNSDFWKIESAKSGNITLDSMLKMKEYMARLVKAPFSLVSSSMGNINNIIGSDTKQTGSTSSTTSSSTTNTDTSSSNGGSSIWSKIKGGFSKITNFIFGKGSEGKGYGTSDPGHIYQRDYNASYQTPGDTERQTLADSGCGPAAAATISNIYGMNDTLPNAANYAKRNGYKEVNGGTYPGYFGDYLSRKGIRTRSTNSNKEVVGSLAQGKPVIMMGQDFKNSGKTPYGSKYSHYVVATGLDNRGNVIVEDPEDRRSQTKYRLADTLMNSSVKITTSGSGKFGRGSSALSVLSEYGNALTKGIYGPYYTALFGIADGQTGSNGTTGTPGTSGAYSGGAITVPPGGIDASLAPSYIGRTASSTDEFGKHRSFTVSQDEIDIYNTAISAGLSPAAACGCIGNFCQECGAGRIRSVAQKGKIWEGGGLMQWTPVDKHIAWANDHGYGSNVWSWESNLAHFKEEIKTGSTAQYWRASDASPSLESKGYTPCSSLAEFKSLTDPASAAVNFERLFEGSGDWNGKNSEGIVYEEWQIYCKCRVEWAKLVYKTIVEGINESSGSGRGRKYSPKAILSNKFGRGSYYGRSTQEPITTTSPITAGTTPITTTTTSPITTGTTPITTTTTSTTTTSPITAGTTPTTTTTTSPITTTTTIAPITTIDDDDSSNKTTTASELSGRSALEAIGAYAGKMMKGVYGNYWTALFGDEEEEAGTTGGIVGNGSINVIYNAALVFAAMGNSVKYNSGATKIINVNGLDVSVRQDCSGYVTAILNVLGYDMSTGSGASNYEPEGCSGDITTLDGGVCEDWIDLPYSESSLVAGDIVSSGNHVEIYVYTDESGCKHGFSAGADNAMKNGADIATEMLATGSTDMVASFKAAEEKVGGSGIAFYDAANSTDCKRIVRLNAGGGAGRGRGSKNSVNSKLSSGVAVSKKSRGRGKGMISANQTLSNRLNGRANSSSNSYRNNSTNTNNHSYNNGTSSYSGSNGLTGGFSLNRVDNSQVISILEVIADNSNKTDQIVQLLAAIVTNTSIDDINKNSNNASKINQLINQLKHSGGSAPLSGLDKSLNNDGANIANAVYSIARS